MFSTMERQDTANERSPRRSPLPPRFRLCTSSGSLRKSGWAWLGVATSLCLVFLCLSCVHDIRSHGQLGALHHIVPGMEQIAVLEKQDSPCSRFDIKTLVKAERMKSGRAPDSGA